MKKILVVYNPKSSNYRVVADEVLAQARNLKGYLVGKYEVKPKSVNENAKVLAKLISDGDLVISAGGDGTATMAVNSILLSGKKAILAVLGYGNFNDMAKTLRTKGADLTKAVAGFEAGKVKELYPLKVKVNGKLWRYVPCYVTMGLFAESTMAFDEKRVRGKLMKGRRSKVYSWMVLARWYFKNHRRKDFLPEFKLNGQKMSKKVTDYVAMNASTMAGVMKGKAWLFRKQKFASATARLGSFGNLVILMAKSILAQTPVYETSGDILEFLEPGSVELHSEGEYERVDNVKKVEIRKAEKCLTVVKL